MPQEPLVFFAERNVQRMCVYERHECVRVSCICAVYE